MQEWSVDYINEYLQQSFGDKFRCELTETKGRILVSHTQFSVGETIFVERPLHIVCEEESNETFMHLKFLCRKLPSIFDQEPLWYWAALCSLTSADLGGGSRAGSIRPLSRETQRKILCLYHEQSGKALKAADHLVKEFKLNATPMKVSELIRCWILNCFDHSEKPQGYASYFGASLMSHSCFPNAIWRFSEGCHGKEQDSFVLQARRNIAPGDEITISYLPEEGLLHSTDARIAELNATKNFICTCERCGPGAKLPDLCRGFRCPTCFRGTVFHPKPFAGDEICDGICNTCGAKVGDAVGRYMLECEKELDQRLTQLESLRKRKAAGKCVKETDVQNLIRLTGTSEAGLIGPQHWLCDRLWGILSDYYEDGGREEEARRMRRQRVEFMRNAYPSLNGELAWTLEAQADLLCKHAGLSQDSCRLDGLDDFAVRRMAQQAVVNLSEGAEILRMLFGSEHSYFSSVDEKRERVKAFLDTGILQKKRKR